MSGKKILSNKYKYHKSRYVGFGHTKNIKFKTNSFCLRSLEYKNITKQQINAAFMFIKKKVKKIGKVFVHVHTTIIRMEKSSGIRMGKGKGAKIKDSVVFVKPGKIIFEIRGVSEFVVKQIFSKCSFKLNVFTNVTKLN